jgi:hypothetical protein
MFFWDDLVRASGNENISIVGRLEFDRGLSERRLVMTREHYLDRAQWMPAFRVNHGWVLGLWWFASRFLCDRDSGHSAGGDSARMFDSVLEAVGGGGSDSNSFHKKEVVASDKFPSGLLEVGRNTIVKRLPLGHLFDMASLRAFALDALVARAPVSGFLVVASERSEFLLCKQREKAEC